MAFHFFPTLSAFPPCPCRVAEPRFHRIEFIFYCGYHYLLVIREKYPKIWLIMGPKTNSGASKAKVENKKKEKIIEVIYQSNLKLQHGQNADIISTHSLTVFSWIPVLS